jgi:hypothetical protein
MRHLLIRSNWPGRRPRWNGPGLVLVTLALSAGTNSFGQRLDFRSFTNTGRLPSGIQIDSLSWNMDYFSLSAPRGTLPNPSGLPLGSVFGMGAGVKLGWYRRGRTSDYEIQYGAEYNGFTRYTQLRGVDQFVSLVFRRKLTPKLEWDFFGDGRSTRVSELLLATPSALAIAQRTSSVNDLSGAISTGASPDVGLNPIAVGASGLDSPFMLSVSGARLYTSAVATGFLYAASPRLFWFGHAQASRLWYRQEAGSNGDTALLPPHADVAASSGLAYLLRRRTQLGFEVDYGRSHSAYHEAYFINTALRLSRNIGDRWLISGGGGPGTVVLKSPGQPSTRSQGFNAAGTIAYKGLEHTFLLSAQRSVSGRLGLGEDHTASGTLACNWQRRGSAWTLNSSMTYQRLGGGSIRQLQGWLASASATRRLTTRTSMVAEFVNASDSAPTVGALNGITRRAARFAVVWSPAARNTSHRPQ